MLAVGPQRPTQPSPGQPDGQVAIRSKVHPTEEPATVLGYVETQENGRRKKTDTTKDYTRPVDERVRAGTSRSRGRSPTWSRRLSLKRVEAIQRHGLDVQELREDIELDVEVYRLDKVERSPRRFEGHQVVELTATPRREARLVKAGHSSGPHGPAAGKPGGLSARAALGGRPGHLEFLR